MSPTDLIIQGFDIETADLKRLAKLSHASDIERLGPDAFRLRGGEPADDIPEICSELKLDYAFVPVERKLADFRLLVMDMDSTLITIETIDELADLVGLKAEVAEITAQAMRGEIEYNESLRRRVAVLKGLEEHALQRVYEERVKLTPGAEKLLAKAQSLGFEDPARLRRFHLHHRSAERTAAARLHALEHARDRRRQADRNDHRRHRERRRQARSAAKSAR